MAGQLAIDLNPGDKPCVCWQQTVIHEGHCCFEDPDLEAYQPGKPLSCGHCPHDWSSGPRCRYCGEAS